MNPRKDHRGRRFQSRAKSLLTFAVALLGSWCLGPRFSTGQAVTVEAKPTAVAQPSPNPNQPPGQQNPGGPPADGSKPAGTPDGQPGKDKPAGATDDSKPKPITRPTTAPTKKNDVAFEVKPDADGKVQFQFEGAPWPALIEWLGNVSGMAIDWQELPGDFVNLRTQRKYTLAETRDLINRHLLARGYTLVEEGELLTVVKTAEINTAMVPRVQPEELDLHMPHEFVKVSFELDWLMAEEAANELKPMVSKNGQLNPLKNVNRIEAIDAVRNLRQIYRVLQDEQSGDSQERLLREFPLEHTRASQVKEKLEQLLSNKKPEMPLTPEQQQQQMMMQQQMQQQQQQNPQQAQKKKDETEIKIIVNQQRNSVMVITSPDKMAVVEEAVKLLDVPNRRDNSLESVVSSIRPYRLATLDPKEVVKILLDTGVMDPETQINADEKSKAIIVKGPPWDHLTVEKLIKKLDGSPRGIKVIRLRRRRADQVATTIENLLVTPKDDKNKNRRRYYYFYDDMFNNDSGDDKDRFRVAADVEHNWLMLWCNQTEYEGVLELLTELGEVVGRGNNNQIRVIEEIDPAEVDAILKRARDAFRSVAPNPVLLPESKSSIDRSLKLDETQTKPKPATTQPETSKTAFEVNPPDDTLLIAQNDGSAPANQPAEKKGGGFDPDELIDIQPRDNSRDAIEGSDRERDAITISRAPDGRLMIRSKDTAALDLFEEFLDEMRPGKKDYAVFKLEHASATWVTFQLEDFFDAKEDDKSSRRVPYWYYDDSGSDKDKQLGLADQRPIRFISEIDTNTIVVRNATPDQLQTVAELIKLYDVREQVNHQTARHTQLIPIKHSKASIIAGQIKDAFRDLLSGNDKAFQQQQQQQQQQDQQQQRQRSDLIAAYAFGLEFGDGESNTKSSDTRAAFKGKLSLGIDDTTNTLLVSTEGKALMDVIVSMIERLDRAAQSSDNVRVVRIDGRLSKMHEALKNAFGEKVTVAKQPPQPGENNGQNQQTPQVPPNNNNNNNGAGATPPGS